MDIRQDRSVYAKKWQKTLALKKAGGRRSVTRILKIKTEEQKNKEEAIRRRLNERKKKGQEGEDKEKH